MERERRAGIPAPGAFTTEATRALRALEGSADPPILLGFYPSLSTNPFQALLYTVARDHGIAPVEMRSHTQIAELAALQALQFPTVLHLHWLHQVMRGAASATDARVLADAFLAVVDAYLAAGGRLVWTVHNILPHEARFDAEEARLCQEVARRCDVVHVLSGGTAAYVAPRYTLPVDRLLHVPLASYAGAYPDHISRSDARHELGILPDELVYLVLGAIRPYKGLTELLDAWDELGQDRARRLVVAGQPTAEPEIATFLERAALHPSVLLDARKVPVPEMQVFLRAADLAVCTHRHALNSAALLLALTFGLPAIVPAGSGLADAVDASFALTYEPGEPGSLVRALATGHELVTPEARRAALAHAAALDPATLSARFATGLRAMLARGSPDR